MVVFEDFFLQIAYLERTKVYSLPFNQLCIEHQLKSQSRRIIRWRNFKTIYHFNSNEQACTLLDYVIRRHDGVLEDIERLKVFNLRNLVNIFNQIILRVQILQREKPVNTIQRFDLVILNRKDLEIVQSRNLHQRAQIRVIHI